MQALLTLYSFCGVYNNNESVGSESVGSRRESFGNGRVELLEVRVLEVEECWKSKRVGGVRVLVVEECCMKVNRVL